MHANGMVLLAAAQGSTQDVPARAQMATTLGFHIILACFGIALPSIVLLAEFIGLRRGNQTAMLLARRWSQVMGVLVAVGAVTGTVLSFEMGLLWPGLMRQYGSVLGVPFGVEGLFFFLEAIFAGIYLWGWRRLPGWAHWWSGVPIAVSGIFGAMAVIAVNSWMNTPGGFTEVDGQSKLSFRMPTHETSFAMLPGSFVPASNISPKLNDSPNFAPNRTDSAATRYVLANNNTHGAYDATVAF